MGTGCGRLYKNADNTVVSETETSSVYALSYYSNSVDGTLVLKNSRGRKSTEVENTERCFFQRLPSQAGVHFVKKLSSLMKNVRMPTAFKNSSERKIIANPFSSADESKAFNRETWKTDILGTEVEAIRLNALMKENLYNSKRCQFCNE